MLAAFVLTLHDDAGRQVCESDRAVGLVHVLAAGAAGPIGVDSHVRFVHSTSAESEISGETSTAAKLVCRLPSELNGLIRTNRCMPVSPRR